MLLYGKGEEERVGNTLETTFDGRKQNVAFRGITIKKKKIRGNIYVVKTWLKNANL